MIRPAPRRTELIWEGKYDEQGNRRPISVPPAPLPLQKVERIDLPRDIEKARQPSLFDEPNFRAQYHPDRWVNRLIWGDNKLVMHSLLSELHGQIDLIYIDPPFDVGADFTVDIPIGEGKETIEKEQSLLEAVAYRDIWGKGTDSYLHYMYERLSLMKELLSEKGSIYVHCDWRVNSHLRLILDEIFGPECFQREIVWRIGWISGYKSKVPNWIRNHDTILFYTKDPHNYTFNKIYIPYPPGYKRRDGSPPKGEGYPIEDTWNCSEIDRLDSIQIMSFSSEKVGFNTQKNENLLERIITASSNVGDLVADFFCGSGTTLAVAERLGRRWIGVDIGRYAIHVSRKRLIDVQKQLYQAGKKYRPFEVYNLGRYERQWWQREKLQDADAEHRRIVLHFYQATRLDPPPHPLLHGQKEGAYVHVVEVDAFLSCPRLKELAEALRLVGGKSLHVLAWDFEMGIRECQKKIEEAYGVSLRLKYIPREIMQPNYTPDLAQFFEPGQVEAVVISNKDGSLDVELKDFMPAMGDLRTEEQAELLKKHRPFDFIDFWGVDFQYRLDKPFEYHWHSYRTRKDRSLALRSSAHWREPTDQIGVKVIDVFGIDTTVVLKI